MASSTLWRGPFLCGQGTALGLRDPLLLSGQKLQRETEREREAGMQCYRHMLACSMQRRHRSAPPGRHRQSEVTRPDEPTDEPTCSGNMCITTFVLLCYFSAQKQQARHMETCASQHSSFYASQAARRFLESGKIRSEKTKFPGRIFRTKFPANFPARFPAKFPGEISGGHFRPTGKVFRKIRLEISPQNPQHGFTSQNHVPKPGAPETLFFFFGGGCVFEHNSTRTLFSPGNHIQTRHRHGHAEWYGHTSRSSVLCFWFKASPTDFNCNCALAMYRRPLH